MTPRSCKADEMGSVWRGRLCQIAATFAGPTQWAPSWKPATKLSPSPMVEVGVGIQGDGMQVTHHPSPRAPDCGMSSAKEASAGRSRRAQFCEVGEMVQGA